MTTPYQGEIVEIQGKYKKSSREGYYIKLRGDCGKQIYAIIADLDKNPKTGYQIKSKVLDRNNTYDRSDLKIVRSITGAYAVTEFITNLKEKQEVKKNMARIGNVLSFKKNEKVYVEIGQIVKVIQRKELEGDDHGYYIKQCFEGVNVYGKVKTSYLCPPATDHTFQADELESDDNKLYTIKSIVEKPDQVIRILRGEKAEEKVIYRSEVKVDLRELTDRIMSELVNVYGLSDSQVSETIENLKNYL